MQAPRLPRLLPRFTRLQLAVHIASLIPLASLVWDALRDNLTINPIQAATQRTGDYAILLLLLSLACTPLYHLTGFAPILKWRRPLGLYAFLYASIHLSIFIGLDYGFDWALLWQEVALKRYVLVGLGAFLILLPMAFTSYNYWKKRLGKGWKRLHRLVYLAGVLAVIHLAWVVKGDVLNLQGDIWKPLLAGITLTLLLAARLPFLRRALPAARMWLRRQRQTAATGKKKTDGRQSQPGGTFGEVSRLSGTSTEWKE